MTQERVWKLKYVNYSQVSFPESGTENEKINPEDSNKRRVFLEKFGEETVKEIIQENVQKQENINVHSGKATIFQGVKNNKRLSSTHAHTHTHQFTLSWKSTIPRLKKRIIKASRRKN